MSKENMTNYKNVLRNTGLMILVTSTMNFRYTVPSNGPKVPTTNNALTDMSVISCFCLGVVLSVCYVVRDLNSWCLDSASSLCWY